MLAAATICDSQGIKNKFFMGIGYRLSFSLTQLFYLALVSPLFNPSPPTFVRQAAIVTVAGQVAVGDKEDI